MAPGRHLLTWRPSRARGKTQKRPKTGANLKDFFQGAVWSFLPLCREVLDGEVTVGQPNPAQWRVIWIIAVLLILGWPPEEGRSLGMKAVNWLVDPSGALPAMPSPLPIGLDDNGDAVAAHDAEEAEYYRLYESSGLTRLRLKLKAATDPFQPTTQRQVLAGVGILCALAIWRLSDRKKLGV